MALHDFEYRSREARLEPQGFDRGLLVGGMLSAALLLVAAFSGNFLGFLDLPSVVIVAGGTLGATLIHHSLTDFQLAVRHAGQALKIEPEAVSERLQYLTQLAPRVRAEGRLLLEEEARFTDDEFLRVGFEMVVDGFSEGDIKEVLKNEQEAVLSRYDRSIEVWDTMGSYAPGLGLIGTLIGLVDLLSKLQDRSQLGSAMSLALLTTLYGAVASNLICLPLAGRLRDRRARREQMFRMSLEGIVCLAREESPTTMGQRLKSFVSARGTAAHEAA